MPQVQFTKPLQADKDHKYVCLVCVCVGGGGEQMVECW